MPTRKNKTMDTSMAKPRRPTTAKEPKATMAWNRRAEGKKN